MPPHTDTPRATSPLNELVRHLALLAAPRNYSLTARLLDGKDGNRIELKATRNGAGDVEEYVRHITLAALERDGAATVAKEFARNARTALSAASASARSQPRSIARKARR